MENEDGSRIEEEATAPEVQAPEEQAPNDSSPPEVQQATAEPDKDSVAPAPETAERPDDAAGLHEEDQGPAPTQEDPEDSPRRANGDATASTSSPRPGHSKAIFDQRADPSGRVPLSEVPALLRTVGITDAEERGWHHIASSLCLSPDAIVRHEFLALVGYLQTNEDEAARAAQRAKRLKETGALVADENVLTYLRSLEAHKRTCEREGRYREAQAAARRLTEIRLQEEGRLMQEVRERHKAEEASANQAFGEEELQLIATWAVRLQDFERRMEANLAQLQVRQAAQFDKFVQDLEAKRPTRAKPNKELLSHRYIEGVLARAGDYGRAEHVRALAAQMERLELEQNKAAFELEIELKAGKLRDKHRLEMDAQRQRAAAGRAQLMLSRSVELERLSQRFRNLQMELGNLQKTEHARIQMLLNNQESKRQAKIIRPQEPGRGAMVTSTRTNREKAPGVGAGPGYSKAGSAYGLGSTGGVANSGRLRSSGTARG